jgi:hypothetical protein
MKKNPKNVIATVYLIQKNRSYVKLECWTELEEIFYRTIKKWPLREDVSTKLEISRDCANFIDEKYNVYKLHCQSLPDAEQNRSFVQLECWTELEEIFYCAIKKGTCIVRRTKQKHA